MRTLILGGGGSELHIFKNRAAEVVLTVESQDGFADMKLSEYGCRVLGEYIDNVRDEGWD